METVDLQIDGGAATIVLNRPDVLNAWNRQFGEDLLEAVETAAADLRDVSGETTPDGHPDVRKALTERYHPIIVGLRTMPKPVIAAVHGPAVGIGCSLALCSDLI